MKGGIILKYKVLILLLSFLYVLLFALESSPLTPCYNDDYGMFRLIGNSWKHDVIPFKELFDSKGPLLFFIQMIGAYIDEGKIGVYICESISLYFSILLLYKIGLVVSPNNHKRISIAIGVVLFVLLGTLFLGNTCEEYSLPFVLYPMFVGSRYFFRNKKILLKESYFSGICFACVSQIRLNNTAIIVGLCLAIFYDLIRKKEYRNLLYLIGTFVIGNITILIPVFIYFFKKKALYDMLYASIIYNLSYKVKWVTERSSIIYNILRLLPSIALPFIAYLNDRKYGQKTFILCLFISLITFLTFYSGAGFGHYYTMQLPILFLCVMMISLPCKIYNILLISLLCLPFSKISVSRLASNIVIKTGLYHYYHPCFERYEFLLRDNNELRNGIFKVIPESERNNIYIYESTDLATFFIGTPYYPVGKFFALQRCVSKIDDIAAKEILYYFVKANPMWVISSVRLENDEFWNGLMSDYQKVDEFNIPHMSNMVYLYRKNN